MTTLPDPQPTKKPLPKTMDIKFGYIFQKAFDAYLIKEKKEKMHSEYRKRKMEKAIDIDDASKK
jgi:hypothetical protein